MTLNIKNKYNKQTGSAIINLQDLLVKASQDAEIAKSAVKEVFDQALRKGKESINKLETLANIDESQQNNGLKSHEIPPKNGDTSKLMNELNAIKRGMAKKITNNSNRLRNTLVVPSTEIVQSTDNIIEAVSLAREKIRSSREEAETYKKNAQIAVATLEEKEAKMSEKIKAIKQQLLISIREAQAKAQKAQDEAKAIHHEVSAAIKQARIENRKMIEDAKMEVIKAQEAARRAKKEAELAISRVNNTKMKVQQEIIGITINETSETSQELEEFTRSPGRLVGKQSKDSAQNLDQNQPIVKFDRVIQLWQNIKETGQHIFHTIKTRFNHKGV
jgi:hypothetical protein